MAEDTRTRRVSLRWPVFYRSDNEVHWRRGETVNISDTGLLFLSEAPVEIGAEVEILLSAAAQHSGSEVLLNLFYSGRVARRVLANWPEVRPLIAIRISQCRVVPGKVRRVA